VVTAILGGLAQREFRDFGRRKTGVETRSIRAFPQLRVSIRACESRTFGLIRRQTAHGGMYPFFEPEEAK